MADKKDSGKKKKSEKDAAKIAYERYGKYSYDPKVEKILLNIKRADNGNADIKARIKALKKDIEVKRVEMQRLENSKLDDIAAIELKIKSAENAGKKKDVKALKSNLDSISADYDNKIRLLETEISASDASIDLYKKEIASLEKDIDAYFYELTGVVSSIKKYGSRAVAKQHVLSASERRDIDEYFDIKGGKYKNGVFSYFGMQFKVYVISFSYSWSLATKGASQARQRQTIYPFRATQSDLNVTLQFEDRWELLRFADYARGYHLAVTGSSGLVGSGVPNMNFKLTLGDGDIISYDVALPSIPVAQSNDSVGPTMRLTLKILRDEMSMLWVNDVRVVTQDVLIDGVSNGRGVDKKDDSRKVNREDVKSGAGKEDAFKKK